jgi:carboxylate-amine ligase
VHPFAGAEGVLSSGEAYAETRERYGRVARRQLVFALQVHVAVGGADRTLAVYNALRGYLPELSALAANSRWHEGRDSEFASVRPKIAEGLPRQGVPPVIGSWEEHAATLEWGAASGAFEPRVWWWELRPHATLGTLEVRVPDAQASVAESAAIVAVVHALVAWLAEERDGAAAAQEHDLDRDRALAYREGVAGALGARVDALLDALAPVADRQGASAHLAVARSMAASGGGAQRQRASFERAGARAAVGDLVERFLES